MYTQNGDITINSDGSGGLLISNETSRFESDSVTFNVGTNVTLETGSKLTVEGIITATDNVYIGGLLSGSVDVNPVRIGSGGIIFTDGTVQLSASTSTGFTATQIASADRLGVVRIGDYLSINSGTGVLSVDKDSLKNSQAWYTLPIASTTTLGGIKVGNGLSIDVFGSLSIATTLTNLTLDNVNLGADMFTNGWNIASSSGGGNRGWLRVIDQGAILGYGATPSSPDFALSGHYLSISTSTFSLFKTNFSGDAVLSRSDSEFQVTLANGHGITLTTSTSQIDIKAGETVLGTDAAHSTLQVNRIYNYAGTNAPFFPAGVQYPDNSIQLTAFYPDQGFLI